jgi:hypothetical protein
MLAVFSLGILPDSKPSPTATLHSECVGKQLSWVLFASYLAYALDQLGVSPTKPEDNPKDQANDHPEQSYIAFEERFCTERAGRLMPETLGRLETTGHLECAKVVKDFAKN